LRTLRAVALLLFLASACAADALEDVLKRMDDAAARFQGLTAKLTYTKVTVVVNDESKESGTIYFQKEKGGKNYRVKIDITEPDPKVVLVKDGTAKIYRSKTNLIEEYNLGKKKELMEQFLLLGFGAGGHELAKAYGVTLGGPCNLNGTACIKLDLQPKGDMTRNLKKVELWLSTETALPIQQKFTEPSNDHLTASYMQVKVGPQPDSVFNLNAPRGAKTVRPGQD